MDDLDSVAKRLIMEELHIDLTSADERIKHLEQLTAELTEELKSRDVENAELRRLINRLGGEEKIREDIAMRDAHVKEMEDRRRRSCVHGYLRLERTGGRDGRTITGCIHGCTEYGEDLG